MADEKKFRVESDLLGELKVPADALYGVQTQRGINNYHIYAGNDRYSGAGSGG